VVFRSQRDSLPQICFGKAGFAIFPMDDSIEFQRIRPNAVVDKLIADVKGVVATNTCSIKFALYKKQFRSISIDNPFSDDVTRMDGNGEGTVETFFGFGKFVPVYVQHA
jgi:hypothetical protein